MTNLRLPGQYDERLLGSLGLQGPYYNWNRWYLPGVGRYLELDPVALRGGRNGPHGPDWYSYANGNPLRYVDPDAGVAVAIPPIIWAAGGAVAAWETYVAMCKAANNCPWDRPPPPSCMEPPKPSPTFPTIEQQPPPPDSPRPPNRGTDAYRICVAACMARFQGATRYVCYALCLGVLAENL